MHGELCMQCSGLSSFSYVNWISFRLYRKWRPSKLLLVSVYFIQQHHQLANEKLIQIQRQFLTNTVCVMTVQGGALENKPHMSKAEWKLSCYLNLSLCIWCCGLCWGMYLWVWAHAMPVLCQWKHWTHSVSFTHTRATHSVSEVTASVFLVFMWAVLPYLAGPVDLGAMKDDLLPWTRVPGWSSVLWLTSLPGSWSSSSSLLLFCSPYGISVARLNCLSGLPRIPKLIRRRKERKREKEINRGNIIQFNAVTKSYSGFILIYASAVLCK